MNSSTLEFQHFDLSSPNDDSTTRIDLGSPRSPSYPELLEKSDLSDDNYSKTSSKSFWTFEYYQQFFDVNTDEVKARIMWAVIPRPGKNYLEHCLKPNPDLYGPFWICTTLIFTIAVSGNVANYLQYAPNGDYHWKYDFHLISYAATAIFSYVCLVPIALYTFMKWNSTVVTLSFLELLCAYGYSMAIYVPVSILSVIQVLWFQWALIIVGCSLSVFTLVTAVGSSVEGPKKIPSVVIVIVLHFLLAIGFLLTSFMVPTTEVVPPILAPEAPVVPLNVTNLH